MLRKNRKRKGVFGRRPRDVVLHFMISSFMLFALISSVYAGTSQRDLFLQSLGLSYEEGRIGLLIGQLSKQLESQPYNPDLYYYLAQAYNAQGWRDKAAEYANQWVMLSNIDLVIKNPYAFMLDDKEDKVIAVNTTNGQVVQELNVGWFPRRIVPTPDGKRLYVTNALADTVSAINAEQMTVENTIKVGRMPWNGKSHPKGDLVYIANLKSDDVSVIDTDTDTVVNTIKVGQGPWGIAVSPDGHRLYVSNQDSQDIRVIDTGSYSIVDIISIGSHLRDMAIAPDDENTLYAVDKDVINDKVEVYIVNLDESRVVNSLRVSTTNDPLLSRLQGLNIEDKIKLVAGLNSSDGNMPTSVTTESSGLSDQSAITRNAVEEDKGLPMGGPEILTGVEAVIEAYTKVPAASVSKTLTTKPAVERKPVKQEDALKSNDGVLRIIIVVKNDTLWQISRENYDKANMEIYRAIQSINPRIKDINKIYVGQEIKLPIMDQAQVVEMETPYDMKIVVVRPNDNLFRIALNNYGTVDEKVYAKILEANPRIKDISIIWAGQKIKLPPL